MPNGSPHPQLELVLPCYNESRSLRHLVESAVAKAVQRGYSPETFRLILVNNGSTDDSAQILKELSLEPLASWFRIVTIEQNRGYGYGVWAGLLTTTAPFVGWTHADEQCDPGDALIAWELLKSQKSESVLVKGVRSGRSWKERFVSRVFELLARLFVGLCCYEINAQPKVFPRALLAQIEHPPSSLALDLYVLYRAKKAGYQVLTIPVVLAPRAHGVSTWASSLFGRYKTIRAMIFYLWQLRQDEGRL